MSLNPYRISSDALATYHVTDCREPPALDADEDPVPGSNSLLADLLNKPDWVRDRNTYRLWMRSRAYPDVLFELPQRFSCLECRCETYRIECGTRVCSWCNGNGRRVGQV